MASSMASSRSLANSIGLTRSSSSSTASQTLRNTKFISVVARAGNFQPWLKHCNYHPLELKCQNFIWLTLTCMLAEATRSSRASICSKTSRSPRRAVSRDQASSSSGMGAPPGIRTPILFTSFNNKSFGLPCLNENVFFYISPLTSKSRTRNLSSQFVIPDFGSNKSIHLRVEIVPFP